MTEQQCPALPAGSVDFNAFHDAIVKSKGKVDLAAALDAATVRPDVPAPAAKTPPPARPAGDETD